MRKIPKIQKEAAVVGAIGIGAMLVMTQKRTLTDMPAVTIPTVIGIFMIGRGVYETVVR